MLIGNTGIRTYTVRMVAQHRGYTNVACREFRLVFRCLFFREFVGLI
jgi:hypothetical protein